MTSRCMIGTWIYEKKRGLQRSRPWKVSLCLWYGVRTFRYRCYTHRLKENWTEILKYIMIFDPFRATTIKLRPFRLNLYSSIPLSIPTSPRASQSMSFAEVGLKGRCAEGLSNAEHSTAECLWKCRWIYGRGICYTITLSHLRFFLHFTPGYTQELWAAMLENKFAMSKREQTWAKVSKHAM